MSSFNMDLDKALKKTRAVFPILQKLSEYGLESSRWNDLFPETVSIEKLHELFELESSFRKYSEKHGKFVYSLSHDKIKDVSIGDKDYFMNIINLTPPIKALLKKAGSKKVFMTQPEYGNVLLKSPEISFSLPEYIDMTGEKNLKIGSNNVNFILLNERKAINHYIGHRLLENLKSNDLPIHFVILQETMAMELWNNIFKYYRDKTNFTIGIALCQSSVGSRILEQLTKSNNLDIEHSMEYLKGLFGKDLLDIDEKLAAEAAYNFLNRWQRFIAENDFFSPKDIRTLMKYEIAQEQFFIKGNRDAPIQVSGLQNALGMPYCDAVILPVNESIFPVNPKENLFLNETYTPEIKRIQRLIDDLYFRQYLSFGKNATVVALDDQTSSSVPSYYFHFLRNEFQKCENKQKDSLEKYILKPIIVPSRKTDEPVIKLTDSEKIELKNRAFSFSSLKNLTGCGFRFYYTNCIKLKIPDSYDDADEINLLSGNFLHDFLQILGNQGSPDWENLYNTFWESESKSISLEIIKMRKDKLYRRQLIYLYLKNCIEQLNSEEFNLNYLLVPGFKREMKITREFNGINFTGLLDKVITENEQIKIIDYKFKKNKLKKYNQKKSVVEQIFRKTRKGKLTGLKDTSQMFMYIFLLRNQKIAKGNISANFLFLKENDPELILSEDLICSIDDEKQFMDTLSQMIISVINEGVLKPNYQSNLCSFCKLHAICRKKDFYRK